MAKTVTISDSVAALLEEGRKKHGYASLDAAAEALIVHGVAANETDDDHMDGYTLEELRALIAEADADGEEIEWDPDAVRAEVLRRYKEDSRRS